MKLKKKIAITIASSIATASLFYFGSQLRNSQLFMPSEYKLIKKTVIKLAKKNYFGEREIGFLVTAGGVASYYAKDVGLCKRNGEDPCAYYRFLNPFKKHPNPQDNEIIKLSYLSGPGYASASSLGTVLITQNYFRIMEEKEDQMVCTIAHELAHIFNLDTFNDSLRLNEEAEGLNDDRRKELSFKISRESEKNADLFAQKMVLKAGYPTNTCVKDMERLMHLRGVRKVTKQNTHPTIPKRLAALKEAVNNQLIEISKEEPELTKLRWKYDRNLNYLKFIPTKV